FCEKLQWISETRMIRIICDVERFKVRIKDMQRMGYVAGKAPAQRCLGWWKRQWNFVQYHPGASR
ncbi:MAG: hypothetical protein SPI28_05640, partial [Acetatifactor sp.]|nr:hypothetical protein [Acetatifactor sp.]